MTLQPVAANLAGIVWHHKFPFPVLATTAVALVALILVSGLLLRWNHRSAFSEKSIITTVVVLGLGCRVVYALCAPAFYAPDELAHFAYTKYVAEEHSLPIASVLTLDATTREDHQPPLYYICLSVPYRLCTAVTANLFVTLHLLRMTSVLLWLGSLWLFIRFIDSLDITNADVRIVAVSLFSLLPASITLTASVNNDVLVQFLACLILHNSVRLRRTYRHAIWLGILIGLCLLSKLTAVVIFLFVGIRYFCEMLSDRDHFTTYAAMGVTTAFTAVLTMSPWLYWCFNEHSTIVVHDIIFSHHSWQSIAQALEQSMHQIYSTVYCVAGISNVIYGWPFQLACLILTVFALSGFAIQRPEEVHNNGGHHIRIVMWCFTIAFAANSILLIRFGIQYSQAQGRHLFTLLFPLCVVIGLGVERYRLKQIRVLAPCVLALIALTFQTFCHSIYYFDHERVDAHLQRDEKVDSQIQKWNSAQNMRSRAKT
jgi:hypothetical protein